MSLQPGDRLGPYHIRLAIGAGGMGEVYRASDTKLGRDVAIKILPRAFTTDPERLARFEREARLLAALNHPHIGAIYGLEEADGVRALVLELVEGDTLLDRMCGGRLPLGEALTIARQIADGLESAHAKGIVHRDLKPANIKITHSGTVKVLDFGLGKAAGDAVDGDLSQSPTVMASGTRAGVILGTAAYMSPDQARGKQVDQRADIWAFGCVLFQMLTGKTPFAGETTSDVIAGILGREPDWASLPSSTPEPIRRLLRRCLEKDERRRLRDIADAGLEIDDARSEPIARSTPATAPIRRTERFAWAAAVGGLLVVAAAAAAWALRPTPMPSEGRFEIITPSASDPDALSSIAISPDGTQLVFETDADSRPRLWMRPLNSVDAHPVAGTDGGMLPFWAPDGRSLAFYADGMLKRIDLAGGLVRPLTAATAGVGGAWNRDDVVLFVQNPASPIMRVPANGGAPAAVTRLEGGQSGHTFPHFLPDGRHFLFYANGAAEARGIYVAGLDGTPARKLFDAESPAVYTSGHLLFIRDATLFAQPFDAAALKTTASPFSIATGVMGSMFVNTTVPLSASPAGAIAYRSGSAPIQRQFSWVDRSGKETGTVGEPDPYLIAPSSSPDGNFVAFLRRVNGNSDIWTMDTRRGILSRLTEHPREDIFPAWSRDGSRIAFTTNRNGTFDLYEKRVAGGEEQLLVQGVATETFACDWSPDGRFLLYQRRDPRTGWDLVAHPLHGDGKPFAVAQTEADERDGQISPDGKRVAFYSNRAGTFEVYVQPFPGSGAAVQVSTSGGAQIRWRPDGRELFYIALDGRLMAVSVQDGADGQLVLGTPAPLFTTRVGRVLRAIGPQYVVSPDGRRFLIANYLEGGPTPIRLILNWHPQP